MYRKIILAAAVTILTAAQAFAAALPEVSGWINGALRETDLNAVSGNHGVWLEREYRTARGMKFLAVLMEGAGPKLWKPATQVNDGGVAPGGESAEKITVAGLDAILESRPILGRSLTVKISNDSVLTLESQSAGKEDLIGAAEILAEKIKSAESESQN